MFYEELYTELGKLFYHLAAADGKVQDVWERIKRKKEIVNNLRTLFSNN